MEERETMGESGAGTPRSFQYGNSNHILRGYDKVGTDEIEHPLHKLSILGIS